MPAHTFSSLDSSLSLFLFVLFFVLFVALGFELRDSRQAFLLLESLCYPFFVMGFSEIGSLKIFA
jgi:hypothetical protein